MLMPGTLKKNAVNFLCFVETVVPHSKLCIQPAALNDEGIRPSLPIFTLQK